MDDQFNDTSTVSDFDSSFFKWVINCELWQMIMTLLKGFQMIQFFFKRLLNGYLLSENCQNNCIIGIISFCLTYLNPDGLIGF